MMNRAMLLIELHTNQETPLYEQIYNQIRDQVIHGKLRVGTKLPSKRKLGEFLQVSQTTIESAYEQLMAEGYIESIPRKGFFVQNIEELVHVEKVEQPMTVVPEQQEWHYDFSPGHIDTAHFPFNQWRKHAKQIIDDQSQHLLLLGDPHGDLALREEIASYLYHSRGVDCTAEQIIIGSGTEQLLPLIIRILGEQTTFAIEDPGYPLTHYVFHDHHRQVIPIAVDKEGMRIDLLQQAKAQVAYVTPSHQFPTGTVLTAARRTALLNWASAKPDRYIIEDDYDSEFRYTGRPIPALYGMAQGDHVIYMSTFSKSLMPSLRIAYTVLPYPLLQRYRKAFIHYVSTVPRLDQHILASFMKEDHFSKHLNKMRTIYKMKLQVVIRTLSIYQHAISYYGEETGMHVTITVQSPKSEEQLLEEAARASIRMYSLNTYRKEKVFGTPSFLLGFGGLSEIKIEEGIHLLMKTWGIKPLTPKRLS